MAKRTVYIALVLIIVGIYFLVVRLDPRMPDLNRVWPAFPLAGGVTALWAYFAGKQRDHGLVFLGTAFSLMGVFLFLITMGSAQPGYDELRTLWPAFIIIGGIGFLAYWLAKGRGDWDALLLSVVSMVFGGGCLAVNLGVLGPDTTHTLIGMWPILLILIGLILLLLRTLGIRDSGE
jgi:hypothetical protein